MQLATDAAHLNIITAAGRQGHLQLARDALEAIRPTAGQGFHRQVPAHRGGLDGGQTRESVNYSQYYILRNTVWVSCEAKFDREFLFNATAQTVTYKLNVTSCCACDEKYYAENYILIPAEPSSYTVLYDVSYTEVD